MLLAKRAAAVAGIALGCGLSSTVSQSDSHKHQTGSWLRWLVHIPPDESRASEYHKASSSGLQTSPGKVLVWGGSFGKTPRPIASLGSNMVRVAASDGIGAAIDDTGKVYGFTCADTEERVQPIHVPTRAADVTMRESQKEVVILDSAGRVYSTSLQSDGTFRPAEMLRGALTRAKAERVRCGKSHCVAITKHGEAVSWGTSNSHGQLGTGMVEPDSARDPGLPALVTLPDDVRLRDAACGDRHTIFLSRNGALYAAGDDHWAQLGISAEPWLKTHQKSCATVRKSELLTGLAGDKVAGGGQHSVLLVKDGTVFSFGFNQWGQLGHHNYSSLAPPSPIADYTVRAVSISAGENHTCLVKDNGELWCIGGNEHGQLGTGSLQPSMTWKKVRVGKKPVKPSHVYSSGYICAVVVSESEAMRQQNG